MAALPNGTCGTVMVDGGAHNRPIVVIGWFGGLFWPYAYWDFVDYSSRPMRMMRSGPTPMTISTSVYSGLSPMRGRPPAVEL